MKVCSVCAGAEHGRYGKNRVMAVEEKFEFSAQAAAASGSVAKCGQAQAACQPLLSLCCQVQAAIEQAGVCGVEPLAAADIRGPLAQRQLAVKHVVRCQLSGWHPVCGQQPHHQEPGAGRVRRAGWGEGRGCGAWTKNRAVQQLPGSARIRAAGIDERCKPPTQPAFQVLPRYPSNQPTWMWGRRPAPSPAAPPEGTEEGLAFCTHC